MPESLQMMSIKQEPVEWSDFEHDNTSNVNKSSIEIAVKPELIYSKGDTDEEGTNNRYISTLHFDCTTPINLVK